MFTIRFFPEFKKSDSATVLTTRTWKVTKPSRYGIMKLLEKNDFARNSVNIQIFFLTQGRNSKCIAPCICYPLPDVLSWKSHPLLGYSRGQQEQRPQTTAFGNKAFSWWVLENCYVHHKAGKKHITWLPGNMLVNSE